MIDYDAYCKIHHLKQQQLRPSQIATEMGLDLRTVERWIDEPHFRPRQSVLRASKLAFWSSGKGRMANAVGCNPPPALC
jgi:hypothetical protein